MALTHVLGHDVGHPRGGEQFRHPTAAQSDVPRHLGPPVVVEHGDPPRLSQVRGDACAEVVAGEWHPDAGHLPVGAAAA